MDLNFPQNRNNLFQTPDRSYNKKINFNSKMLSTYSPNINDNRFISNRENNNLFNFKDLLNTPNDISECNEDEQNDIVYQNLITNKFLNFDDVISEKSSISNNLSKKDNLSNNLLHLNSSVKNLVVNSNRNSNKLINNVKELRKRSKIPYKVLDAPGVRDDFYLNILDWSKNNILGISLDNTLYLWDKSQENRAEEEEEGIHKLDKEENSFFSSIKFSPNGNILVSGTENGNMNIYDPSQLRKISEIKLNFDKITCFSFYDNNLLSIGGKDNIIRNYDIRDKKITSTFLNHTKEIINLKWESKLSLLASGSDDNLINIWDLRKNNFIYCLNEHVASTKALEWSKLNKGYLISGGGNNDNRIIYWNTNTGKIEKQINTDSQVCNLIFSQNTNEFISTHGYMKNRIIIWDYYNLEKKLVIEAHTQRVLHACLSPNGEDIVTSSADETLKFWNLFPKDTNNFSLNKEKNFLFNFR